MALHRSAVASPIPTVLDRQAINAVKVIRSTFGFTDTKGSLMSSSYPPSPQFWKNQHSNLSQQCVAPTGCLMDSNWKKLEPRSGLEPALIHATVKGPISKEYQ